jgi:hypothetical protein
MPTAQRYGGLVIRSSDFVIVGEMAWSEANLRRRFISGKKHRRVEMGEGASVAAFEKKARGRSIWGVSPCASWPG